MAETDRKRRILVVDDEPDTVTFLTALLQDHGYDTSSAGTGAEALRSVRAAPPDLITLDVTMPEESGVRAYRELKTDPALRKIPVVIVTGVTEGFRSFISGRRQVPPPEGYLSKPIAAPELLETIRKLLA